MNKLFLSVALVTLIFINPVFADRKMRDYYVAVFCSPEFMKEWSGTYKPNYLQEGNSWSKLDTFLARVADEAGERPIVIDLDCHGNEDGLSVKSGQIKDSYFGPMAFYEKTSVGYVVNKINKHLAGRSVTVLLEACFSGDAYKNTIRNNRRDSEYDALRPEFPIYGIGSGSSNIGCTVYLQFRDGKRYHFEDLRDYETKPTKPAEEENCMGLSQTSQELYNYFVYQFYSLP